MQLMRRLLALEAGPAARGACFWCHCLDQTEEGCSHRNWGWVTHEQALEELGRKAAGAKDAQTT